MKYLVLKTIGSSVGLVVISVLLSMVFIKMVPYEFFIKEQNAPRMIILKPGQTVEDYNQSIRAERERRRQEQGPKDPMSEFMRVLEIERFKGLIVIWLPWFMIPFFRRFNGIEMLVSSMTVCGCWLLGVIFWFEALASVLAFLIGIILYRLIRSRKEVSGC